MGELSQAIRPIAVKPGKTAMIKRATPDLSPADLRLLSKDWKAKAEQLKAEVERQRDIIQCYANDGAHTDKVILELRAEIERLRATATTPDVVTEMRAEIERLAVENKCYANDGADADEVIFELKAEIARLQKMIARLGEINAALLAERANRRGG